MEQGQLYKFGFVGDCLIRAHYQKIDPRILIDKKFCHNIMIISFHVNPVIGQCFRKR